MKPKPLLRLASEATNWTDLQLSDLVGKAESTVQAIRSGRIPEHLTAEQKQRLADEIRGFLQDGAEALAEIEMRS